MTVKNILAGYTGMSASGSALRHAIRIAKHNDAWITGVVSHRPSAIERQFGAQLSGSVKKELRRLDTERIESIEKRFAAMIREFGDPDRAEFVDMEDTGLADLSAYARLFDLVVMGNPSELPVDAHLSANPDRVALQSGRPVVIIPDHFESTKLADHALIAWDGQRAAARALGDAMPVLEEKPKVTVLTVGKAAVPGTDRLITNLERHGIKAELLVRPRGRGVGRTILNAVDEIAADIIIMGAYEHSKFAHDLVGGVTTDVMRETKVPVFMSH